MPASIMIVAFLLAWSCSRILGSVEASLTLPSKISVRLRNPLGSSAAPRVMSGLSLRFSLDLPRFAFGFFAMASPSI